MCSLNVSSNISQLYNECIDVKEDVKDWRTIPRTLCCQDALTILIRASAEKAKTDGQIFMGEYQWRNCIRSFGQPGQSCGFDNLLQGRSQCSSVAFSNLRSDDNYRNALERCSHFNTNTSFDSACKNCSEGILDVWKQLLNYYDVKNNETEKAVCGLAVLISVAAGKNDSQSSDVDHLFRCLPELQTLATGTAAFLLHVWQIMYRHNPFDRPYIYFIYGFHNSNYSNMSWENFSFRHDC